MNDPLPDAGGGTATSTAVVSVDKYTSQALAYGVAVLLAIAFAVATFATAVVVDRVHLIQHLQYLAGVDVSAYWLATLLCDAVVYVLALCLVFAAGGLSGGTVFSGAAGGALALLLLFGLAALPLSYLASFAFDDPASAYAAVFFGHATPGLLLLLLGSASGALTSETLWQLEAGLSLFPGYSLAQGVFSVYANHAALLGATAALAQGAAGPCHGVTTADACCAALGSAPCDPGYLGTGRQGIGAQLGWLAATAVLGSAALLLIEFGYIRKLRREFGALVNGPRPEPDAAGDGDGVGMDADVAQEQRRVLSGEAEDDCIVLDRLTKEYPGPWCTAGFEAVRGISVGVARGQCFGLLGVNGAGKSTTFRMLTGEETISAGAAQLDGADVGTQLIRARRQLGYVPQADALIGCMTGREQLRYFARLRGLPESGIEAEVGALIDALLLNGCADRRVSAYSGGNKRKLCTAVALIGAPPIVLLDEPTTGMDPRARRYLHRVLHATVERGQALVLTSHSIYEAERLCNTVGIMVNGVFRCFGTPQHLKSRFGEGVTIMAKATGGGRAVLEQAVARALPGAVLQPGRGMVLEWRADRSAQLASLFAAMERVKAEVGLDDYAISQPTLENVFVQFARGQEDVAAREEARRALRELRYE